MPIITSSLVLPAFLGNCLTESNLGTTLYPVSSVPLWKRTQNLVLYSEYDRLTDTILRDPHSPQFHAPVDN